MSFGPRLGKNSVRVSMQRANCAVHSYGKEGKESKEKSAESWGGFIPFQNVYWGYLVTATSCETPRSFCCLHCFPSFLLQARVRWETRAKLTNRGSRRVWQGLLCPILESSLVYLKSVCWADGKLKVHQEEFQRSRSSASLCFFP